jgi:hypothetical protein
MAEFDPVTGRITLTKAHIASEQGQRLIQLILEIGLDGQLTDTELIQLSDWLKSAPQEIPAIRHLRELVSDALNDGVISDEERKILHKQIERILPSTERERLVMARKTFEDKKRTEEHSRAQQENEMREKLRADERAKHALEYEQRWRDQNMATERQLSYIKDLGGSLPANATKQDASELIDRLLHSNGSISPRQCMVLRFWKITPEAHWGKAQVSVWMDVWYEGDHDRQLAWELFKEETGDTGTSQDPERVPLGAGYAYLRRVKSGGKTSTSISAEPSGISVLWLVIAASVVLAVIGAVFFQSKKASVVSNPSNQQIAVSSESSAQTPPASPSPAVSEQATPAPVQQHARRAPSYDSALEALARNGYEEKPLQIPATVIDVGILKNVPYLSYRIGNDRELNIYGDPEAPAGIEIGLYRTLLNSNTEKHRCITLLSDIFADLDFGPAKPNGGKILSGNWVIEVTMPDEPDAYGGWWVSVYNLDRLHQAAGTRANVSVVSESPSSSQDWTPQELSCARPSSSGESSRVYVRSYTRKDGTYVHSHTRRK